METILKTWQTDTNFWDCNPILLTVGQFKKLHASDKSKGKKKSSTLMWAIALCIDMHEHNIWRNYSLTAKQELIKSDYLEDPDFNWEHKTILELIEVYKSFCMTTLEKDLYAWEKKLEQRTTFLDEQAYTMENAKDLDSVFLNSEKITNMITSIKEKIKAEAEKGKMKGGASESASEQGLI